MRPRDRRVEPDDAHLIGQQHAHALARVQGVVCDDLSAQPRQIDEGRRIAVDNDLDLGGDLEPRGAPRPALIERRRSRRGCPRRAFHRRAPRHAGLVAVVGDDTNLGLDE